MKKYILPSFLLALPSLLSTLINNSYYERIMINNNYLVLLAILHFSASFFIMLYFVKKFKHSEGGIVLFKNAFRYSIKLVFLWSFFSSIFHYVYYVKNKELLMKITNYSIEIQKQKIIASSGNISASAMKIIEKSTELQKSPLVVSLSSFVIFIFVGALFSLIIAAIVKTKNAQNNT